jgi:phytoene dehydrogenase-like protein
VTAAQYGERFRNPLLRSYFTGITGDLPAVAILFSLAWMGSGNGGYPVGGSLGLIELIEKNYRDLGGEIRFNPRVKQIIVQSKRATLNVQCSWIKDFSLDITIT